MVNGQSSAGRVSTRGCVQAPSCDTLSLPPSKKRKTDDVAENQTVSQVPAVEPSTSHRHSEAQSGGADVADNS